MATRQRQSAESCNMEGGDVNKEEAETPPDQSQPVANSAPDGGWGWVILVSSIVVLALTLAFPSCMSIFYTDLQKQFHASNSVTSWVPSIMTAVLHAGGPLCSLLVERFGCRATVIMGGVLSGIGMAASAFTNSIVELYITAGVITGLGFCFSFQPAVTILGQYFVRRRVFANAMSSTGTALGLSTLPTLSNYLHTEFGWRGSFLILGGMLLNCCVCGALMRPLGPSKPKAHKQKANGPTKTGKENLKLLASCIRRHMAFDQFCNNQRYRVFSLGVTWMMLGFVVPLIFLVPFATDNGMDQNKAALLLNVLGFVNIIVRPAFGLLFNLAWFKGRHIYVLSVALLLNGLSNCICCFSATFPVLLVYMLCYGLTMSVVGTLLFTVLMDIVEMNRFLSALGLLAIMESVTLLIGPPLAGLLVDKTGEYTYVYLASSITVVTSALFLLVSFYWLDYRSTAKKEPSPVSASLQSPDCQYIRVSAGEAEKQAAIQTERVTSV
ncbi:monocarboxylate transporter 6 [Astyanax mexicanus]|uniref:Monocarboxylate transporter 6 n=1 Tax=Astyanax mexicanus TaxID=7994 RepID=A0A8B9KX06_ASTMX|nr:monocarboxylate transporter 6 [Astyanax mexicanus]